MNAEYYLKLVQRNWYILLAGLMVGALSGLGIAAAEPKQYTANASGFITTSNQGNQSIALAVSGDNYAKSRAKSYADLGTSRVVADAVIEDLGLQTSPESLVKNIDVVVPPDTVTIQVTAKASSAEFAREIANSWIKAISEQVEQLESSTDQNNVSVPAATLQPLESAVLPTSPSSPIVPLYVALGGFLGLVVAGVISLVKGYNDKRIRSVKDIENITDIAIIGKLPVENSLDKAESRLLDSAQASMDMQQANNTRIIVEGLRDLRTNLEFINVDNPPQSIVVTSALPGDGKSMVAANLATIIAQAGQKVILIDADLRKPTVAKSFNIRSNLGLTDLLAGRVNLEDVTYSVNSDIPMRVLPAGTIPPNPAELLASKTMQDLVEGLNSENITVIMDAPPVIPVTDAAILSAKFDGTIFVTSAGITRTDLLKQALTKIESVKGHVLGLVLNRIPLRGIDKNAYAYYGNSYSYGENLDSNAKK